MAPWNVLRRAWPCGLEFTHLAFNGRQRPLGDDISLVCIPSGSDGWNDFVSDLNTGRDWPAVAVGEDQSSAVDRIFLDLEQRPFGCHM